MADATIKITGLEAAERAFAVVGVEAPVRLREELVRGAGLVTRVAQAQAALKGDIYKGIGDHGDPSRHSGDLIEKIRPQRTARGAAVVERSRTHTRRYPEGYRYPRRLEYGDGGARAFMRPAAEIAEPAIQQAVDEMIDRLFEEEGF